MSVLSDSKIKEAVKQGTIKITDFDESRLGPNSYNLRLGKKLLIYTENQLDMKKENKTIELEIPEEGYLLLPEILYLGETMEWTECGPFLPMMEGRSSIGRLGIDCYVSAGSGDVGFKGKWTLEIRVIHPVRVYPGVDICQLLFHEISGKVDRPYRGKYLNSEGVVASRMDKDFTPDKGYYYDDNQLNWYNYNKSLVKDIFKDYKSRPFIFGQEEDRKLTEAETDYAKNFISDIFGEMLKIIDVSNDRKAYYIKEFKVNEAVDSVEAEKHAREFVKNVLEEYPNLKEEMICNCGKFNDLFIPIKTEVNSNLPHLNPAQFDELFNMLRSKSPQFMDLLYPALYMNGSDTTNRIQLSNGLWLDIDKLFPILNNEFNNLTTRPFVDKVTWLHETKESINSLEAITIDKSKNKIIIVPEYRDKSKDIVIDMNKNSNVFEIKFK